MAEGRRHARVISFLLPLAVVALVWAGMHSLRLLPGQGGVSAPLTVAVGKDYYVTVSLVELSEKDPAGERWDAISESGPDIFVEIFWKGNRIYKSTTKNDTFVAKWSNAELNLRAMAFTGERASMDDVIRAARVNVKTGEELEIRVYDEDLLGNVVAGTQRLVMSELHLGDTTYTNVSPSVKRLTLRVSDMAQSMDPLE